MVGTYPIIKKMAAVSPANTLLEMRLMAATLPGLIDMLPDPTAFDAEPTYDQRNWPSLVQAAPLPAWLRRSLALKRDRPILRRTTLLSCVNRGTASTPNTGTPLEPGPRRGPGDGTVPTRSAVLEGVPAFRVKAKHSDIPEEPRAIQAVIDLLRTGTCALPPVTTEDLDPARTVEESVLPETIATAGIKAAASGVTERLRAGRLSRKDGRWLLAPDFDPPPVD